MDEGAPCDLANKRARQPPSIPFLWEERPGTPKKDWRPGNSLLRTPAMLPAKLIASVPFLWEEEPGKPRNSFSPSTLLPTSPSPNHGKSVAQPEEAYKSHEDFIYFESDESFSSPPYLIEFSAASETTSSSVTPIKLNSPYDHFGPRFGFPSSSSDGVTSKTSLAGPSFLEYLFPLHAPDSGFLGEVKPSDAQHGGTSDDDCKIMGDNRVRHKTLQDLIMLSRRGSITMKAAETGTENQPLVNSEPTTLSLEKNIQLLT